MEFKVNRKVLVETFNRVASVIDNSTKTKALKNARIDIKNNKMSLLCTDRELFIRERIEVESLSDGSTTVPIKLINGIIKGLKDETLKFKLEENTINLNTMKGKFEFDTIPIEQFPMVGFNQDTDFIEINNVILSNMIDKTIFALPIDSSYRPELTKALFEIDTDGSISIVCTDSRKLSKYTDRSKVYYKTDEVIQYLVSRKTLLSIVKILSASDDPNAISTLCFSENKLLFLSENISLISILSDKKYPDYNKVIPKDNNNVLDIKTKELSETVKRVTGLTTADYKAIVFNLDNLGVSVETPRQRLAKAYEEIDADWQYEALKVGLNGADISSILNKIDQPDTSMFIQNSTKAVVIEPKEQDLTTDSQFVVIPVRII